MTNMDFGAMSELLHGLHIMSLLANNVGKFEKKLHSSETKESCA